ncbi:MAG: hypothetical protein FWD15_01380 [Alphaproteobacteria bacterium]|nr:hypothetical protein [Alphaproteobacteria bacterium]
MSLRIATSRFMLTITSLVCIGLAALLLVGSIGFYNAIGQEAVRGIVIQDAKSEIKGMVFTPLVMAALGREKREEILRRLIVQYIVQRYTLSGSEAEMRRVFGTGSIFDMTGAALKLASYSPEQGDYGQPFASIVAEAEERGRLLTEGTTRTVEIIGQPQLYKDMWITNVDFIYRTPGIWRREDATRESYEIQMVLEPFGALRMPSTAARLGVASAMFDWYIKSINRVKK